MIIRFLDWCDSQDPMVGMPIAILVGTLAACSGLLIFILLFDYLDGDDQK